MNNQLQKKALIPYNVLSFAIPSEATTVDDIFTTLKTAWETGGDWGKQALQDAYGFYQAGKIDYLELTKLLVSLGAFVPEVGAFVPYVNKFLDFVWPKIFGGDNNSPPNIFEQLKPQIQELINQTLTQDEINFLDSVQAGVQNAMSSFNNEVALVQTNPTQQHINDLHAAVIAIQTYTNGQLPLFQQKGYEVIGLPYLASIVTLQLMTLQTVIQAGSKWGYDSDDINSLLNASNGMKDLISKYSKYIVDTFMNNLPPIDNWNARQEYVRQLTLFCLDYVALWPTLVPEDYPTATDLDLTRAIFSNEMTSNPSNFSMDPTTDVVQYPGDFVGVSFTYLADQSMQNPQQTWITPSNTIVGPINPPITLSEPVVKTDLYTFFANGALICEGFYITGEDGTSSGNVTNNGLCGGTIYEGEDSAPANHKLSQIIDTSHAGTRFSAYVNAYVYKDLEAANTFGSMDSSGNIMIKGLPAEKGVVNDGYTPVEINPVLVREWVNGANAVNLTAGNPLTISATNLTGGQYHVRVRYANAGTTTASLTQSVETDDSQIQGGVCEFKSTTDANIQTNFPNQVYVTGQQGNYVIQDISWPAGGGPGDPLTLPSGDVYVSICLQPQETNTQVFIDRIELIPLPAPITSN
ncbi:insecticidal delta-endotoxin Cry8Ea1 family protein [Bacillus cereus]|uniref:insecticidal delta-endotoxin Cry8Ea1 family protein n=1 Tax=Bacillus cereus TaxID=1396 RepID=UPI000995395D|nr:insecticidal delta-endotoxin Cry8Ea1 family protein [Bacillus cereus]OPA05429.1 hypothetical protein BHL54_27865 [Bacillus cereus]